MTQRFSPAHSLSTKAVQVMWITMWMKGQLQAVPQFLADCSFGRQPNPSNFSEI
jgi:hypothetical protein